MFASAPGLEAGCNGEGIPTARRRPAAGILHSAHVQDRVELGRVAPVCWGPGDGVKEENLGKRYRLAVGEKTPTVNVKPVDSDGEVAVVGDLAWLPGAVHEETGAGGRGWGDGSMPLVDLTEPLHVFDSGGRRPGHGGIDDDEEIVGAGPHDRHECAVKRFLRRQLPEGERASSVSHPLATRGQR